MSEKEVVVPPEEIGLPQNVANAVDVIQEFCRSRTLGCTGCPMSTGMPEGTDGCVYHNFIPAEIDAKKIIDINSYNVEASSGERIALGSVVSLKGEKFIVLDYIDDNVILLHETYVDYSSFGNSANYSSSAVRRYLNSTYYDRLSRKIGKENIVSHRVDIASEDGRAPHEFVDDYVSLMTADTYRKYSKYISNPGWWWLATKKDGRIASESSEVCTVTSSGTLSYARYSDSSGYIRPFCVLKASVLKVRG